MEPTMGEIRMFAGNFAPRSWAFCEGQLLSIAANQALFSILGTMYGGDGRTTFALPDLRGRVPVSATSNFGAGEKFSQGTKTGQEKLTLTQANLPAHNHIGQGSFKPKANSANGTQHSPEGRYMAGSDADATNEKIYTKTVNNSVSLGPQTFSVQIANSGGGVPIDNSQPSIALNYIICLMGDFPRRG
ncbi:MAG: phage tail protein [Bacteroidetes bacterium]|nr:phage tail protein [Bacteroidota bacterium]MCB0854048.1 phage tail protein [Bacteroidota bacterium]